MIYKGACVLISDEGLLAGAGWESGNPISRQMSVLSDVLDTLMENGSCPPARAFSPEQND